MPTFENKDGSLTLYSFACGHIQRAEWADAEVQVDLSSANMEISLWDIKVTVGDHYTWLQRFGLKKARQCWAKARSIAKRFINNKLSKEEACRQIDMLGFEK